MNTIAIQVSDAAVSALDAETIDSLRELGGDELLTELVALFSEDTPPRVDGLATAVASGDLASIASLAHSLKSSCANVGAKNMSAICLGLERAGKSDSLADAEPLLPLLQAEWALVSAALTSLVG